MSKILMVLALPMPADEVFAVLSYMQGKHPEVKLSTSTAGNSALLELRGLESAAQDAAAEIKRGLKINNCRVWHEQIVRGTDA